MMSKKEENITTASERPATLAELLVIRFRLRAERRVAWLRKLWQTNPSGIDKWGGYHQEIDRMLLGLDQPGNEYQWYQTETPLQALNEEITEVEALIEAQQAGKLAQLVQIFGLDPEEVDILQACWVLAIESGLARLCGYLHDQTQCSYLSRPLIAQLYGHNDQLPIAADSPLISWQLVQLIPTPLGQTDALEIDPYILDWLMDRERLDTPLVGAAFLQLPQAPLVDWPLAETLEEFDQYLKTPGGAGLRLQLLGEEGSGRKTFAAAIAQQLGMNLLVIDADRIPPAQWPACCLSAYRQAFLDRCAIAWQGSSLTELPWPSHLPPFRVQFVISLPGQNIRPQVGLADKKRFMPSLSLSQTLGLLQKMIPATSEWDQQALLALLQQYHLNIGQLNSLARLPKLDQSALAKAMQEFSDQQLGQLAQPLATPFRLEDLIVSETLQQQIDDFIYEARERRDIWERPELNRLFPQGRGLLALLNGPPGTGKTMTAQVIAAQLNLPLYRIDLSAVVSKYVGETAKNLERILSQARNKNVVLLFDEADALFGKRTDVKEAQDRFANTDTNFLLQAIEQFPGIALLTSNKMGNIDYGFIRRLRYVMEFPRPDARQRSSIWQRMLAGIVDQASSLRLQTETDLLAENLELTGAQIKLAVLSAYISARKREEELGLDHLIRGVEQEWRKEGRGLSQELRKMLHRQNRKPLPEIQAN